MKKVLLGCVLAWSMLSGAQTCWSVYDKAAIESAELDDDIALSIRDSVTCEPLPGVQMKLMGQTYRADALGVIHVPIGVFEGITDQRVPISLSRAGLIPLNTTLNVMIETVWNKYFAMTKALAPQNVRMVLQWGDKPRDIDLHLQSQEFHISYVNMRNYANKARLDIDARQGYGPETITLDRIDPSKTYVASIVNYTHEAPLSGYETVAVYANNTLDRVIHLPATSAKSVELFRIVNGTIVYTIEE